MLPTFAVYYPCLVSDVTTFEVRILSSNRLRLGRSQRQEEVQNVFTEGSIRRNACADKGCSLMRIRDGEKCLLHLREVSRP